MLSTHLPVEGGYYRFRGKRYGASRRMFTQVNDLVLVVEHEAGFSWFVIFFGKSTRWPLRAFEGVWERVDLSPYGLEAPRSQ